MVNSEYLSLMPPCTPQNALVWKINYMETLRRFGIEHIKEEVMPERDYFKSGGPKSALSLCSQSAVFMRKFADGFAAFRMHAWGQGKV